jgi:hypothetical protein
MTHKVELNMAAFFNYSCESRVEIEIGCNAEGMTE